MYNSRRYNNKDDSDSDDNNRFRSSTSNNYGNNNYSYARTSTLGNTNDRYATSYRSPSAYATSGRSGKYSDSDDNLASSSNRYGANTRRSVVRHSDSEDSDRYDSRRSTSVRRGGLSARPGSSRRDYDSDSYDSANVIWNPLSLFRFGKFFNLNLFFLKIKKKYSKS